MKGLNQALIVIAGGLFLLSSDVLRGQDWPQWRGPSRDGKVAGFNAPRTWPGALRLRWKAEVGTGDATPALVADRLYVFSRRETNEVASCLDTRTGKVLWQDSYAAPMVTGPDVGHGGPRSSPVVARGRMVTLGVCGTVSCLDIATGKPLWRKEEFPGAWPQFHTAMSPIVVDATVVVHLGDESSGALVAYDLDTGNPQWKWTGDGPAYASPVVLDVGSTRIILTQTAKRLVGIDAANGKLLWQAPFPAQGMAFNAVTPIVDGSTAIYFGQGRGGRAVRIEERNGRLLATELWSTADPSIAFNSPVLKNGLIFGLSQRGRYFCLKADSGQTAWIEGAGGRGDFGAIVDAGPALLGLTATGQLTVFEPSAQQFMELARFQVSDQQTYAHPVLAGNRLFIKDRDTVTLWSIE